MKNTRILFLAQNMSNGTLNGGELATKSNFNALSDICGKDNISIIEVPMEQKTYKKYIYYFLYKCMYSKKIEQKIIQQIDSKEWDIIFFDGSWFGKISSLIKNKGVIIAFFHNVEHQYSLDRLKKNILTFGKYLSVSYNERCLIQKTDYVIALNARDEHLIEKYYQRKTDLILPIALKDNYSIMNNKRQKEYTEKILLFVGSYFNPNKEGIKWFIKKIMPYVDAKLLIVGKGMEKLKKYENKKVIVLGKVEDLSEFYQIADVVVIPLFSGGGMKVKTAEAMMYGKKILATKEALTGYDVHGIEAITECSTKEEFIFHLNDVKDEEKKFYPEVRQKFLDEYEQFRKTEKLAGFLSSIS